MEYFSGNQGGEEGRLCAAFEHRPNESKGNIGKSGFRIPVRASLWNQRGKEEACHRANNCADSEGIKVSKEGTKTVKVRTRKNRQSKKREDPTVNAGKYGAVEGKKKVGHDGWGDKGLLGCLEELNVATRKVEGEGTNPHRAGRECNDTLSGPEKGYRT